MKIVFDKVKALPFLLTVFILAADQIVKAIIVKNWPMNSLVKDVFDNGLLQIYHVRNKAIAFSLGTNFPDEVRLVLFIALPVIVLGFLFYYYWTSPEIEGIQRWAIAGIIGGGLGNISDRIFRPDGVVDFVSVKFYGLFGLERWPTFNIADASVVVSCLAFLLTIFVIPKQTGEKAES
ncbi:lipoprotein signal peptidase [Spirochaetia bacterium]|nr:lipoprotein signal peptidase [Spirochaetia bacterium]